MHHAADPGGEADSWMGRRESATRPASSRLLIGSGAKEPPIVDLANPLDKSRLRRPRPWRETCSRSGSESSATLLHPRGRAQVQATASTLDGSREPPTQPVGLLLSHENASVSVGAPGRRIRRRPATCAFQRETSPSTNTEPFDGLGSAQPRLLFWISSRAERQSAAGFSGGDEAQGCRRRRRYVSLGHRGPFAGRGPDASRGRTRQAARPRCCAGPRCSCQGTTWAAACRRRWWHIRAAAARHSLRPRAAGRGRA
jgi:hypothetical protein